MNGRVSWSRRVSARERRNADLFFADLVGAPAPSALPRSELSEASECGCAPSPARSNVEALEPPVAQNPSAPVGISAASTDNVLRRTLVTLPITAQRIEVAKVIDSAGQPATRATMAGRPVDLDRLVSAETSARLRRDRQIHPTLRARLQNAPANQALPVLVWLDAAHDLYDKTGRSQRSAGEATSLQPRLPGPAGLEPRQAEPDAPPADAVAYRAIVRAAIDRAKRELPSSGVRVTSDLETVPAVVISATPAQVRALSLRSEVVGLFLHEPNGIVDLTDSLTVARAAPVIAAGVRGNNVRVGVWEPGPDVLTNLRIEEFFDTTQAQTSDHGRLVAGIIKNRQASGPHGYAPDAKTYSANSFDLRALNWAVTTKECRVINQSFHRESEQTSDTLSADDLVKDYLALHYPFPTIVQAAGNQSPTATTEFVNHKGFNSVAVGNHDDTARLIRPSSVFRNPTSTHADRELPEICANGDAVTAVGVTMGGTSFASPAVAGTVALLQGTADILRSWPEGSRAILFAGAGRNVRGQTWWDDVAGRIDGQDGAGALDTQACVQIARARKQPTSPPSPRGFDVGSLHSSDFGPDRRSRFRYRVSVPAGSTPRPIRVALAWNSKVTFESDATATPPVRNITSRLTVDLDLHVYDGTRRVAASSSFDNSYEVVDFQGTPGTTYDIVIMRWSGTDWVWFGVAWNCF